MDGPQSASTGPLKRMYSQTRGPPALAAKAMRLLGLLVAGIATSPVGGQASARGESVFWDWFAKNEARLFSFEQDQERIFDELAERLHLVNPDLTFEIGPVSGAKREFVISAGGSKAAFPSVEALYAAAPPMPRWTWVKFRPRRAELNDLIYGDTIIKADDVHYILAKDGDRIGIVLFFDGYSKQEDETFGQIGYLFLDEALGEFTVETKVGFIEFENRESRHFSRARPLRELADHFDAAAANIEARFGA